MSAVGWPVRLADGPVEVRPLRLRDATAWSAVRTANEEWLSRWEGRPPANDGASWYARHSPAVFSAMLRGLRREARAGRVLPCAILYDGRLAGQVTVGNVIRGAFDSGYVGYWVDSRLAGRGIAPTAIALLADHCFAVVGLHRIEANIRPENSASLRVVEKLGFTREALHRSYLYIDGGWRDHVGFALLREDVPEGVLRRYRSRHAA